MKILHTADIHLGSNAFGRIDPKTGRNQRLLDFENSFRFMVDYALSQDIDLFLFCGDAYRTADPSPTEQQVFAECLRPVADQGIPIVMLTGNHDHPVSFGNASAIDIFQHLAGDVHVFRRPASKRIDTTSGPLQLLALPWPVRSVLLFGHDFRGKTPGDACFLLEQIYVSFIADECKKLDPGLPTVLAGHFSVNGHQIAGSERRSPVTHEPTFTPAQLTAFPIDYVALGHIHRHQNLATSPDMAPVVYSSSIERVTFNEADQPKGFCLVTIQGSPKTTSYEFIETPARRFLDLNVDVRGKADPSADILAAIQAEEVTGTITRLRYSIEEARRDKVDVTKIRSALKSAFRITSVESVCEPIRRKRRTQLTRNSGLQEALEGWIDQHDHLAGERDNLVKAALELEADWEASRTVSA